ncbi:MAG: hypothetical protein ABI634_20485 [Acidobacteriota bacterium]
MGKRELLIVAAFVIIGAVAYHVTAPAPEPGQRAFSFSALVDSWRSRGRGPRGRGKATTTGTIPVGMSLTELSVSGVSTVSVTAEPRADVAWALDVESAGPDDAIAERAAKAVVFRSDEMGNVLALAARGPRESGQGTTLRLQVPKRLSVRLDGARRITAVGLAALRLDNVIGDVDIRDVVGAVTGTHRNGTITIAGVGSVSLTLVSGGATLSDVRGDTSVNMRNGSGHFRDLHGALLLDASSAVIDVTGSTGAARMTVAAGALSVINPQAEVRIDARGTKVEASLDRAVPLTAIVTGGIRLTLAGDVPIALDAIADAGTIVASDFALTPDAGERGATLHHVFGTRAQVALRSDGGEIVIARRK